jgi:hypothetical protein
MKIEFDSFGGQVRIDLTTPEGRRGNGAMNQGVDQEKYPGIEVYYGGLHASVRLKDVGIEIIMDPFKGDWENGFWAREQAWAAVREHFGPAHLHKLMEAATERGKKLGAEQAQGDIRAALGL